tara:strand:- start:349 stop:555 length:207 start_codon:yes stop_codon:yes gene_type:complete
MKITKQQLKQLIKEEIEMRPIFVPNALLKYLDLGGSDDLPDDIKVPVYDVDLEKIPDRLRKKYGGGKR